MSLVTVFALVLRLLYGGVDASTAYRHASIAVETSDPTLPPELLLAIAYVESRFDPTATSRIEGATRRTGPYPSIHARGARGPFYCGPLQTYARDWSSCVAMRDLATGYRAGAAEMKQWMRDARVGKDVYRALLGHGCGNLGLSAGRCGNGYPNKVMRFAELLGLPRRQQPGS
jgi:hypothetical protein